MATVVGPPILDNSLQQALLRAVQPIAQGMQFMGMQKREQQDLQNLLGYDRDMAFFEQGQYPPETVAAGNRMIGDINQLGAFGGAFPGGNIQGLSPENLNPNLIPKPQFPEMTSPKFRGLLGNMLMQQQLQTPLQEAQAEYYRRQSQFGKPPWWAAGATQEEIDAYKKRVGGPLVQIETGQKLLTEEQRKEIAEDEFTSKVTLSSQEKNIASKSAARIIDEAPQGTPRWWLPRGLERAGQKNFPKKTLIEIYKQWRLESTYPDKSGPRRKRLDDIWDRIMKTRNRTGKAKHWETGAIINIGRNEYDWNPNDPDIKALRNYKGARKPGESIEQYTKRTG